MWMWGKTRQALRQAGQPESVECSVIDHVSSELRSSDGRRPTTRSLWCVCVTRLKGSHSARMARSANVGWRNASHTRGTGRGISGEEG